MVLLPWILLGIVVAIDIALLIGNRQDERKINGLAAELGNMKTLFTQTAMTVTVNQADGTRDLYEVRRLQRGVA